MNILHLMKDYKPTIGGSVVRNSNMIENYLKQIESDTAVIINLDGEKYESFSIENGIHVYRTKRLIGLIKTATKIIQEKEIDIIQSHNFRFLFAAFIARVFARKKISIFVEIHAIYNMSWYKELLSRILLKKVDGIVVLAECAKQFLVDEYKLNSNTITVIRNGIDASECKTVIKDMKLVDGINELKEKYSVVLYTGSFYEWQGVNFVADEFDNLLNCIPEIAIVMIGNGPDYEYVEDKYLKSPNKERILLHQGISKPEILTIYDMIDVLMIPRLKNLSTNTAVPLKVIEAMEYGKCIVSANDNGLMEVLNNSNALLFESGNITSLIEKLREAVLSESLRESISKKASDDAKKMFVTWGDSAKKMNELYHRREKC